MAMAEDPHAKAPELQEQQPQARQTFELGVVDVAQMVRNKEREEAAAASPGDAYESAAFASEAEIAAHVAPTESQTLGARIAAAASKVAHRLFYGPIARQIAKTNIRFVVSSFPHRIGHQASELDFLLKEIELGKRPPMRPVLLADPNRVANKALLEIWSQRVRVIANPLLRRLLRPLLCYPDITYDGTPPFLGMNCASPYAALLREWGDREPLVELPKWMEREGRAALKRWGMAEDGWFVCIHNREPGYSPEDEAIHRHRNASIANYRDAIEEIVSQGGFVVRMGDPTMRPAPNMRGVYDYAHSDERAPHLDIFLAARCRFFVGTTSGLMAVATMFNRPCAMTNAIPYGMAPGLSPRDVSILKLLKDEEGRFYRFSTTFQCGVSRWRSAQQFRDARVKVVQNAPDEIRDLVIEMIERDEGRFHPTEDDRILQDVFLGHMDPRDFCYGSGASVGRAFLRKYAMFI